MQSRRKRWTEVELDILKEKYFAASSEELEILLGRKWEQIKIKASKLKIKRATSSYFSDTTVHRLLENTPEALYWIGFILADGHIQSRGQLAVTLALKDAEHLEKLAKFLGCNVSYKEKGKIGLRVMNVGAMKTLCERFGITSNKTYTPPQLPNLDTDLLLSLILGFIDGDGCISKQYKRQDAYIRIKCHSNWLPILQFFTNTVNKLADTSMPLGSINNQGYAQTCWCDTRAVRLLKESVLRLQLPVLLRKWERIEVLRVSKYEIASERLVKAMEFRKLGYTYKMISKELDMSESGVCLLFQRNGAI